MTGLIDMSGQRFGRLEVLHREGNLERQAAWVCRCDCGAIVRIRGSYLRRGINRSCGCFRRERAASLNYRAGLFGSVEYNTVLGARARCQNPRNKNYASYGGRGIEYRLPENPTDAAALVVQEIGPRPRGMSLDRIDNNGHYEIGNLRWATPIQQRHNQRPSRARTAVAS